MSLNFKTTIEIDDEVVELEITDMDMGQITGLILGGEYFIEAVTPKQAIEDREKLLRKEDEEENHMPRFHIHDSRIRNEKGEKTMLGLWTMAPGVRVLHRWVCKGWVTEQL